MSINTAIPNYLTTANNSREIYISMELVVIKNTIKKKHRCNFI